MKRKSFTPHHISVTSKDLAGNNGIGRYILLPGSDGRAKEIAQYFNNSRVIPHARGHNVYLGTIDYQGINIDIATVASGMGCASMEIILHELFHLGAKRFLRVGTAGSLQPHIHIGDLINTQASVRDESTTLDYAPQGVPAIASLDMVLAITKAMQQLGLAHKTHTGIVHSKASFYAREFSAGPKATENDAYLNLISAFGVLASEMETSALFIQSQLYHHTLQQQGKTRAHQVLAGAILGILAIPPHQFANTQETIMTTKDVIKVGLETIKILASQELR